MAHTSQEDRGRRAATLSPLFAIARQRGLRRGWIAGQTGVTINRLWNYEHGYDRVPASFIERFSQALGVPASLIAIPEPRDFFIQSPKSTKTPQQPKQPKQPKGGRKHGQPNTRTDSNDSNDSNDSAPAVRQPGERVRRASRATPSAQAAQPNARTDLPGAGVRPGAGA